MRIVNVMLGQGQGGIEQAIVDYCEALQLLGHEAIAIVYPGSAITFELGARGIKVHALANRGAWDPLAIWRLRGLIKRIRPDACIAHGNRGVSLLSMAKAPRIVGAMHNYKIKYENLRFLFYPTQDLLHHLQRGYAQDKHFYHVPNMVRVPANPVPRKPHMPMVIGSMGRFVAKKGFALFIESLALLKARGIPFRAKLAGGGEEGQALRKLAADKDLGEVLQFSGWVEDKQAFFDSLDLFCLPSRHEPFGIVLLEAMAQGLPVVATSSEGPSEILGGGEAGVLVPKDDRQALADALAALIANPEQAVQLGRNAYALAKSRYDLPVVAQKLDLALQAICRL